jgi:hypothetical protein
MTVFGSHAGGCLMRVGMLGDDYRARSGQGRVRRSPRVEHRFRAYTSVSGKSK